MSEFFEPPPPQPPEPETRYRQPAWFGPPEGTLPGVVALELVLARTERVAVCITRLAAYPTGFEFELVTMSALGQDELDLDPLMFGPHRPRRKVSEGLSPELLRIGVQFADGSKATNIAGFYHDDEPPTGPIMNSGGGGGGGGSWRQTQWVWPLPLRGQLAFACEWPAAEITLTRHEIDTRPILEAADRAQVIFSDEQLSDSRSGGQRWTTYGSRQVSDDRSDKPDAV